MKTHNTPEAAKNAMFTTLSAIQEHGFSSYVVASFQKTHHHKTIKYVAMPSKDNATRIGDIIKGNGWMVAVEVGKISI